MTTSDSLGLGEDLLGADAVLPDGDSLPGEHAVVADGVGGRPLGESDCRGGGGPLDVERVATKASGSLVDAAGDEPLDAVGVGVVDGDDRDGAGVFDAAGVDTVDAVDAGDPLTIFEGVAGEGTGGDTEREAGSKQKTASGELGALNESQLNGSHGFILPRWAKAAIGALVLFIAGAMAFAIVQPITVLPRIRLAPGFGVIDQSGELFTSESTRGTVTLYSFSTLDCDERCRELADTMSRVQATVATDENLAEVDVRLVTIALDADPTAEQLQAAADASGADGETWRWVGGTETQIENLVGIGFKRYFETEADGPISYDGGYVIVDGWGVVRGDYKYQTLSDDGDKLARHLGILGAEIRYANGAGAFAYEAAHLFLCYP